jgi:uncharacterized damage-inducible protein DinB
MNSADLLVDGFGRVRERVAAVLEGLSPTQLAYRVDDEANTIAWLVWHIARVQDDHVADVAGHDQVYTAEGWVERFNLPFARTATGYGHDAADVAAVTVDSASMLGEYYDAVDRQTISFVSTLSDSDLDRIVDRRWDPPVTLGVRLVSVLEDCFEHLGQAAFIRGVLERR